MLRPFPESLPEEEEQDSERAPECDQGHVGHDGWHVSAGNDPRRDEFGKPVTPDVLIDGDTDEHTAGDGFVAVDGVGGGDGGESCNLDTSASIADDDNRLRNTLIRSSTIENIPYRHAIPSDMNPQKSAIEIGSE